MAALNQPAEVPPQDSTLLAQPEKCFFPEGIKEIRESLLPSFEKRRGLALSERPSQHA